MNKGFVQVISGKGLGKTSLAIGKAISALNKQKTVIMIQFLKGNTETENLKILEKLEPDMKVFRFEKASGFFDTLSAKEKNEEKINILNGFNFARKVASTGECDVLILDEILGAIDEGIILEEELEKLISAKEDGMDLIITGNVLPEKLKLYVDVVTRIDNESIDKQ